MRALMSALIMFVFSFFISVAKAQVPFDVVFDLDWTLVYKVSPQTAAQNPQDIIEFKGEFYRLSEGAIQSLKALHQTPGVRVSFFSGGSQERNLFLIQHLYAELDKISGNIKHQPYKILNLGDLTPNPEALPNASFAERFKKDLKKINQNLNRILIIEDIKHFTPRGQERNLFWLGSTLEYFRSFAEAIPGQLYHPRSFLEWVNEMNKIPRVVQLILKALKYHPADPLEYLQQVGGQNHLNRMDLTQINILCAEVF